MLRLQERGGCGQYPIRPFVANIACASRSTIIGHGVAATFYLLRAKNPFASGDKIVSASPR